MRRFRLNLALLTTAYCLQATPGLETFLETGFNPLKPMSCEVVSADDDGSLASGPVGFQLSEFNSIESRKLLVEDSDVTENPVTLNVNCVWREGHYICEWNEFYWISIQPERTWRTQSQEAGKSFVFASGQWLQGVRSSEPVQIQCRQELL